MKRIVLILLVLILSGCRNNTSSNIEMSCNGTITKMEIKENDILSCQLLGTVYEFKVTKIEDKQIIFEASEFGLTSKNSLRTKEKEFILNKMETLTLSTQTTDVQEQVIFSWK